METEQDNRPTRWKIRGNSLELSNGPLIMGILNVTPNSFSDGGLYFNKEAAIARAHEMVTMGADVIDVGGESSRPGSSPVGTEEELDRVIPVISELTRSLDVPISIDTFKPAVAEAAAEAGAHILNDISGLQFDSGLADVAAKWGLGLILMHMHGVPRTMQKNPHYDDLLEEISSFLHRSARKALDAGVERSAIVLDPGIGFGKTFAHNWEILSNLNAFIRLGFPLLIGASRKRFLQEIVGDSLKSLEIATVATSLSAYLSGAHILRVHDVHAHRLAINVLEQISRRNCKNNSHQFDLSPSIGQTERTNGNKSHV